MPSIDIPTWEEVRAKVQITFGVHPCDFQIQDTIAQLEQREVITISPTGSGKTLTFWLPLLFNQGKNIIVITALNVLGDQNVHELTSFGISAVNITAETITSQLFKDIAKGQYRVIIVSPEIILNNEHFRDLWANKAFVSRLFSISIDEAHCIIQWGADFWSDYSSLGKLRFRIPETVPFHVVSATLPPHMLTKIISNLSMQNKDPVVIRRSNDRPNIHMIVEEMQHSLNSWLDLDRILRLHGHVTNNLETEPTPPPPFLVFTNKRREAEVGCEHEWTNTPNHYLKDKVVWFHSGMSTEFRAGAIEKLKKGTLWGIICTDAVGMGLNIPHIKLIIQWRYLPSICTLQQRFGRAARSPTDEALAVYLVEAKYFDGHIKKKTPGNITTKNVSKRKVMDQEQVNTPWKRPNQGPRQCVEAVEPAMEDVDAGGVSEAAGHRVEATMGKEDHGSPGTAYVADRVEHRGTHSGRILPLWKMLKDAKFELLAMDWLINAKK